jgi:hypothetical protein
MTVDADKEARRVYEKIKQDAANSFLDLPPWVELSHAEKKTLGLMYFFAWTDGAQWHAANSSPKSDVS